MKKKLDNPSPAMEQIDLKSPKGKVKMSISPSRTNALFTLTYQNKDVNFIFINKHIFRRWTRIGVGSWEIEDDA